MTELGPTVVSGFLFTRLYSECQHSASTPEFLMPSSPLDYTNKELSSNGQRLSTNSTVKTKKIAYIFLKCIFVLHGIDSKDLKLNLNNQGSEITLRDCLPASLTKLADFIHNKYESLWIQIALLPVTNKVTSNVKHNEVHCHLVFIIQIGQKVGATLWPIWSVACQNGVIRRKINK